MPNAHRLAGRLPALLLLLALPHLAMPAAARGQEADPRTPTVRAALAGTPGATRPVWILLHPGAAVSDLDPGLSAESLRRRLREGVGILPEDRPLPEALLRAVEGTGARVRHVSRWLRAVSADVDSAAASRLAALPEVREIRLVGSVGRPPVPPGGAGTALTPLARVVASQTAEAFDSVHYGPNFDALVQLGIPPAHRVGLTGAGVRVALLDTGFEPAHVALAGRAVVAAYDFIQGDTVVSSEPGETGYDQERHGTQTWSLLGGYRPGLVVGPAHGASFLLAKVDQEPGDTQADEDRWVAALEWAEARGADVVSSSLSYRYAFIDQPDIPYDSLDGDGTLTTRAADAAARRGVLVVNSVGNNGPGLGTLSSPADGDSVLAVGAVDAAGNAYAFSSRGPTADGRVKPDLAARGGGLLVASSVGLDAYDASVAGTSFATPLVAAGAALVLEAWPELSAAEARQALGRAGSRAAAPDVAVGRGVPNVAGAILFPDGLVAAAAGPVGPGGLITTVAPVLAWTTGRVYGPMRPLRYTVEVATNATFTEVVYTDTVSEATTLELRRALPRRDLYYWRVRAESPTGATRVSTLGGPFTVSAWTRLLTFAGTQTEFTDDVRPEFRWSSLTAPPPAGPLTYEVQVLAHETGEAVQVLRNLAAERVEVPEPLGFNRAYRWRVIARSRGGVADTVESVAPFVVTSTSRPPTTQLYQNFPNPFPRADLGVDHTRIWFDLERPGPVRLTVHDLRGRLVKTLIPADRACGIVRLDAGIFGRSGSQDAVDPCVATVWDGTDDAGRYAPRGIYLLRLEADGQVKVVRAVWQGPR